MTFHTIAEFSRANCVTICTFLVPAILLATLSTMVLSALRRPSSQVQQGAIVASFLATIMILHVYTWFAIGVVQIPTYILLWLAITCLCSSLGAVLFHRHYANAPNFGSYGNGRF